MLTRKEETHAVQDIFKEILAQKESPVCGEQEVVTVSPEKFDWLGKVGGTKHWDP